MALVFELEAALDGNDFVFGIALDLHGITILGEVVLGERIGGGDTIVLLCGQLLVVGIAVVHGVRAVVHDGMALQDVLQTVLDLIIGIVVRACDDGADGADSLIVGP